MIDLRSDTVTKPTPEMRKAMAEAEVGDDVFGEDPTVRMLEEEAAARVGKDAGLYVPSGTMANQVALKVWLRPGRRVILDQRSHIAQVECVPLAMIAGAVPDLLATEAGWFGPEEVEARLDDPGHGEAPADLVCVENTHNMAGGRLYPLEVMRKVAEVCRRRGLKLHLDGARLFNAAVATDRSAAELAAPADSVMFCLSKGLGAPVGSVLCGSADFIREARHYRAALGGAMRQAGVIAAAGLVALRSMTERLFEDHRRARRLAEGLAGIPGIDLNPWTVETNIVIFRVADAPGFCTRLQEKGILAFAVAADRVRMVTHYHLSNDDISDVVTAAEGVAAVAGVR